MANPASIADIEARWRPLTAQEIVNANAFLGDAWALLTNRRPTLEVDMSAEIVSPENVVRVVCAMVLRVLKNPDGYESESLDDWNGRRSELIASGLLHVTPDELADVTPGRRQRRSVRLVKDGDE
jgi:hypothetical protein